LAAGSATGLATWHDPWPRLCFVSNVHIANIHENTELLLFQSDFRILLSLPLRGADAMIS
jgi:hypothetical protein